MFYNLAKLRLLRIFDNVIITVVDVISLDICKVWPTNNIIMNVKLTSHTSKGIKGDKYAGSTSFNR